MLRGLTTWRIRGGTLPPDSLSPDTQDWIAAFKASAANDSYLPLSVAGYDGPSTDLGEIVVIGDRPWYELYNNWWEVGGSLGGDGPDPWTDSGGGGDGGQTTDPTQRDYDACEDRQADTLADDINDEIRNQPDSDRREYGALIWRDDQGNLHRTALVPGSNGSVPFPADPTELGLDSYSRVVGMVHSHPSLVDIGTNGVSNWVSASHGWIWGGDWLVADDWVNTHNLDPDNFTMYISFEGQIREYDYFDNQSPELREPDNFTDAGSAESGDYNPGASCP